MHTYTQTHTYVHKQVHILTLCIESILRNHVHASQSSIVYKYGVGVLTAYSLSVKSDTLGLSTCNTVYTLYVHDITSKSTFMILNNAILKKRIGIKVKKVCKQVTKV